MPFITDAELQSKVADLYKKASSSDLPTHQLTIISRANARAYSDIVRYLGMRGLTPGQIANWSERVVCNQDLGIYYSILEIGILKRAYREQLDMYAKWIPDLERGRDWGLLQTVRITDDAGNLISPEATDAPINNCYGQINNDMVDSQGNSVYQLYPNMDF